MSKLWFLYAYVCLGENELVNCKPQLIDVWGLMYAVLLQYWYALRFYVMVGSTVQCRQAVVYVELNKGGESFYRFLIKLRGAWRFDF